VETAHGARAEKALGLYRAEGNEQLDGLLSALPLHAWMQVTVTPLEPHPSDPG
jgi:muconolactone D-isomerase